MCFAILLPNELKSGVARFTTNVQTYLATNQVVADCGSSCKMLRVVLLFATNSVDFARFTGPRQTCMAASDVIRA